MKLLRDALEVRAVRRYDPPPYPTAVDFQGFVAAPPGWTRRVASPTLATALLAGAFGPACGGQSPAASRSAPPPAPVVDTTPAPEEPSTVAPTAATPVSAQPPDAGPPTPTTTSPPELPTADRDAVLAHKGPFSWTAAGLPIAWMPYGTGAPARMSEEKARQVVERLFAQAGIKLRRDVAFERPGIACELDGYDEQKRIGYEFVTWQDIEDPRGLRMDKEGDRQKTLSHDEIQRIMHRGLEGEERIAIIHYQDGRFSWAGHPNRGTSEASALQALSANLQKYLAWLRSQGAL